MPPESCRGRCRSKPLRPTVASMVRARWWRSLRLVPAPSRPKATLSITLGQGNRLSPCHIMIDEAPTGALRPFAGSTIEIVPVLGASSPPTIWISVLLPQPLGPSRQENRPDGKRWRTVSSAVIGAAPATLQILLTASTRTSIGPLEHDPE